MDKFTIIGGTKVKAGDYVKFKMDIPKPVAVGYPLKSSVTTHTYEGTVSEVGASEVCLQTPNHSQWVTIPGAVMIEHRAHREVGYWELTVELTLSNRDSTGVYYWDGTKWRNSPNGREFAVANYKLTKEHYLGPSSIESN